MKSFATILAVAVVLMVASSAQAVVYWTGSGDGSTWGDRFNWSPNTQVPQAADTPYVGYTSGPATGTVNINSAVTIAGLYVGAKAGNDYTLQINSGWSLSPTSTVYVGGNDNTNPVNAGIGTLKINGGTYTVPDAGNLRVGYWYSGTGTVDFASGTFTVNNGAGTASNISISYSGQASNGTLWVHAAASPLDLKKGTNLATLQIGGYNGTAVSTRTALLKMGDASGNQGTISTSGAGNNGWRLVLAGSADHVGYIQGYGTMTLQELYWYGGVIADSWGAGGDKLLDISGITTMTMMSTFPASSNTLKTGSFAYNHAKLKWQAQTPATGNDKYIYFGRSAASADYVNSAKVKFANVSTAGAVNGYLLAKDVSTIPTGLTAAIEPIGVWQIDKGSAVFTTAALTLRYDTYETLPDGKTEADLKVYMYKGGAWTDITSSIDQTNKYAISTAQDYADFGTSTYFAVGTVAVNEPPIVEAGSDNSITLPTDTCTMAATVTDDGRPVPPGAVTKTWTQTGGPNSPNGVTFSDSHAEDPVVTFTGGAGTYTLQLEADDGGDTPVTDTVTITVNPATTGGGFSEDFLGASYNTLMGAGTGANYVPGTWTVFNTRAMVYNDLPNGGFGNDPNGVVRLKYGEVGPGAASNSGGIVRTGGDFAGGTYTARFQAPNGAAAGWYGWTPTAYVVFAYQDPNNFYFVRCANSGGVRTQIGYRQNNVDTVLVQGSTYAGNYRDFGDITITWDPAANTISSTVTVKDCYGAVRFSNEQLSATDPNLWEHGNFGAYALQASAIDLLAYMDGRPCPDFLEDFTTTDSIIGTGSGVNYVPGADWTMDHGCFTIASAYVFPGSTGAVRMGYGTSGPNNGVPHRLLRNQIAGGGIYTMRSNYRQKFLFGYQDANNYYIADTQSGDHPAGSTTDIAIGKCINGVTTYLGSAILTNLTTGEGPSTGAYELTVNWDPENNLCKASIKVFDANNVYIDGCTTPVIRDDIGGGDPDWKYGRMGCYSMSLDPIDKLGFTNASNASIDDQFTFGGVIGAGTGGSYIGSSWVVEHGIAKLSTAGTFGTGTGVVLLGDSTGVGPDNGVVHRLLSNSNKAGGEYAARVERHTQLVFGYADSSNYCFAEIKSASRTVGGDTSTKSFAIGKVVGGTTTWLGHAGTFAVDNDSDIYEMQIIWDPTNNKISGIAFKSTYSAPNETVAAVEAVAGFADGDLRESGKFGVVAPDATVRTVDQLKFASQWCSYPNEGVLDCYGGHKAVKGAKTGFFHVQKLTVNNASRWMWVDPEGNGFVPVAISGFNKTTDQFRKPTDLQLMTNTQAVDSKLGASDMGKFKGASLARMRGWGINTLGWYTFVNMSEFNIPKLATVNFTTPAVGAIAEVNRCTGNIWYKSGAAYLLPDVHNPVMPAYAESQIRRAVPNPGDPRIISLYADETDYLKGFMSGHNHLGLALLVGKPLISSEYTRSDWANSTAYTTSSKVNDAADGSFWDCKVAHTSAASPATFAQDRAANPTYWKLHTAQAISANWANSTSYAVNDKRSDPDDGTFWKCAVAHTSASSGTFAADRAARPTYWTTQADFDLFWPNYAKQAFHAYLIDKYTTIESLNNAWGMNYSTWNDLNSITYSSAVYGNWITLLGRTVDPNNTTYPAYKEDLDQGFQNFVEKWATIVKDAKAGWDNNHAIGQQLGIDPNSPKLPVAAGLNAVGALDFLVAYGDANTYVTFGNLPCQSTFYVDAPNDSPMKFVYPIASGSYSKQTIGSTDYLRVHADGADFWWGVGTSYVKQAISGRIEHINDANGLPTHCTNPGVYLSHYYGNEAGGGYYLLKPSDAYRCGTVDEWITALNGLSSNTAVTTRWSYYAIPGPADQPAAAVLWQENVDKIVNDQAADGTYYRMGTEKWCWVSDGWTDSTEWRAFGLMSPNDNALGPDPSAPDFATNPTRNVSSTLGWDNTAGTWDDEADNYGDFTTGFKNANLGIYSRILGLP